MDPFPIPDMRVRDIAKGKVFTKMDVRNSYWHIPIAEEDQDKTAFVAIGRQFRFKVMPMDLTGAPATLTRALANTLKTFIQEGLVRVYYDDVVLATNHPGNQRKYHCEKLGEVLVCLKRDGWKLNEKKCEFMKSEIDVLGHRVTHNQLQVTPSYAAEMENWPEPSPKKELQRFIGFVGFYAKFIPQYSEIAAPLTSLTGSAKFVFAEAKRNAFETLKKLVISRPVLRLPAKHSGNTDYRCERDRLGCSPRAEWTPDRVRVRKMDSDGNEILNNEARAEGDPVGR